MTVTLPLFVGWFTLPFP